MVDRKTHTRAFISFWKEGKERGLRVGVGGTSLNEALLYYNFYSRDHLFQ